MWRMAKTLLPWSVWEYPGTRKAIAELAEVSEGTVKKWLYKDDLLPRKHAARFAALCRERAAAFEALAIEFEEWAVRPVDVKEARKGLKRERRGG